MNTKPEIPVRWTFGFCTDHYNNIVFTLTQFYDAIEAVVCCVAVILD